MDWSFLNVDERHSIMELTGWSTKKLTGSKKKFPRANKPMLRLYKRILILVLIPATGEWVLGTLRVAPEGSIPERFTLAMQQQLIVDLLT
ncbi:hypothetical protein CRP738_gp65 [Roseobacter phage CRP-738]|nr:hypothetical protein CRP738_gp65 [Roseobacter phage CRP-738]